MRYLAFAFALLAAGCAVPPPQSEVDPAIREALAGAEARRKPAAPQIEEALLPPLRMEMPQVAGQPIDPRFDLSVANAPAAQVFSALVAGTRYSMLVHPTVSGNISINLKDVTLREALDSIRELYGFEYRIEGTRIFIQPAGMQARVFQVNYLAAQRRGLSQLRVTSNTLIGGAAGAGVAGTGVPGTGVGAAGVGIPGVGGAGIGAAGVGGLTATQVGGAPSPDSTRVTTNQEAVFWSDLCEALVAIVFPPVPAGPEAAGGAAVPAAGAQAQQAPEDRQRALCNRRHESREGVRSIVVSPQSGVVVVRALPAELRAVEGYLRATRLAVERQVMLEAKIIEVTLGAQFQSGINWAAFNRQVAIGQLTRPQSGARTLFESSTDPASLQAQAQAGGQGVSAALRGAAAAQLLTGPAGAVMGLAVATSHFAALLSFLETQGTVQVLSSPRVATLNNQKAVLKVGQDQLFVSNVTVTPPTASALGTVTTAATVAPVFSPYFSGIVLDVTPQIDDRGMITLHIHPTINDITPSVIRVDLGGAQNVNLPIARNTIRETDTIVRVADGSIVAIGGLMRTEVNDVRGGVPGSGESGPPFLRNTNRAVEKKELVILLKPTIIDSDRDWAEGLGETRERVDALGRQLPPRDPAPREAR